MKVRGELAGNVTTVDYAKKKMDAYKFMTGIEGMDRFGTGPIRSSYFMLSSTELQTDFDGLVGQGVLNNWNYPTNASALPSEWGSVFNIRILTSSEAPVARNSSANGRDVYYNTVVGKQALTHINQDGYSMNLIYRDPYYSGMLAQNATLAVKFAQAQAKMYGLDKFSLIDLEFLAA